MNLGKITIITPPDKIFNFNISYLLVRPSITVTQQFQTLLCQTDEDINVFIYDSDEADIDWLLSVSCQADIIIIDVDNCDVITTQFITFMLSRPNAYYITNNEVIPYELISKNRIYDLNGIIEQFNNNNEDDDDSDSSEG